MAGGLGAVAEFPMCRGYVRAHAWLASLIASALFAGDT